MLSKVDVDIKHLKDYEGIALDEHLNDIRKRAEKLKGLRVFHVNATAVGGGVAEILSSMVGMMNDAGLNSEWYVIPPDDDFFNVTKKIHNTLQSQPEDLSPEEQKIYTDYNKKLGEIMDKYDPDVWIIHDPQPAAMLYYAQKQHKAIWRCHIDTSKPRHSVWEFIKPFIADYKKYIFSLDKFVPEDLDNSQVIISPPSIDPLSDKNQDMDLEEARAILRKAGLDTDRPIVTQVSRFDPWKDPKGVIDAFKIVKKDFPDIQLAMLGLIIAKDDPEAFEIFDEVKAHAGNYPDIHLFADPEDIPVDNDTFVKAFQTATDVVIQKSIKEGFGLVVTEALWKGNPVIGGNVGGITLQIKDGVNGFLVNNIEEAAERLKYLLQHHNKRIEMGKEAKETVRRKFLHTRLLDDYLKTLESIV